MGREPLLRILDLRMLWMTIALLLLPAGQHSFNLGLGSCLHPSSSGATFQCSGPSRRGPVWLEILGTKPLSTIESGFQK